MARLFGTDGVRGVANELLTAELTLRLSQAAAAVLGADVPEGRRPLAVVARDPRISGDYLAAAVEAGLASSGVDVHDAGVLPTPAAAFLVADIDADFGVMISASHNPAEDNGIKFLARGGQKLDDAAEMAIEEHMAQDPPRPTGGDVGRVRRFADAEDRYLVHLLGALDGTRLDGLKIVLDCAHGAASGCSPQVFTDAGAEVVVIGADPDGLNINDGFGSTHLENLQEAVVSHGADLGIAHDGDADRCLAVDHAGAVVDGDEIMGILAAKLKAEGRLADDTLVVTVMSNLGLKLGMQAAGVQIVEAAVGDRYVLEAMRAGGYSLGGEQSGHLILSEHATTGDGVLTGLQLAARVASTGSSLRELADAAMTRLPQVLVNVKDVDKARVKSHDVVQSAVADVEGRLGEAGRVLLRPSGTEPVVRVMVEATTAEIARAESESLAEVVRAELAL
ncbi:phosphoglucosamine mutase [Nesterenkonia sp. F]|uniref:phosphoglucosamine mutase n=1 Tax=Nesterenkonia sp. F TaxID=795955 RepID=UPI000255D521|nr:phosphoglucosamine mutase [Nesterenkonia sp. F]